jgi:lysophospholipase L1-like esterase
VRRLVAVLAVVLVGGCGGGAKSPAAPAPPATPTPEPAPASFHPVSGLVFYDENGSGVPDGGEHTWLEGVAVTLGGRTAATGGDGAFTVLDVPAGMRMPEIAPPTLPPFFRPGRLAAAPVPPPAGYVLSVPVLLPIGTNHPHVYMAFGDSITSGDGSRGARGYRSPLQSMLDAHWGQADVVDEGIPATRTDDGAARIAASLAAVRPAYTLVHYGTNDWNIAVCRNTFEQCPTVRNLQSILQQVKAAGSLPVWGTIVPVNPAVAGAEERNRWVDTVNTLMMPVARAEGAVIADLNGAFKRETSDLRTLFSDHVHPNDRGYGIMAEELFRAITSPIGAQGAAAASAEVQRPRQVGRRSARPSVAR